MKTTKKHFNYFCEQFQYWADQFHCVGWKFFFEHEDISGYAEYSVNLRHRAFIVRFTTDWDTSGRPLCYEEIDNSARHEALHLLIGRVVSLAHSRWVTEDEIMEAAEELTRKLERIFYDPQVD